MTASPAGAWVAAAAFGGDATAAGWGITALYFLASAAALRRWRRVADRRTTDPAMARIATLMPTWERRGWLAIALALAAFGVNKQLDLQTWFTALGRSVAKHQGWYPRRRAFQLSFILSVAVVALAAVGASWAAVGRRGGSITFRVALAGMTWLAGFYLMRGISYHHVDALLGVRLPGAKVRDLIEAGGLFLAAAAAAASRGPSRFKTVGPPEPSNASAEVHLVG